MKRAFAFAVALTLVAGCSSSGAGVNLLPGGFGANPSNASRAGGGTVDAGGNREVGVQVTMRIPKRHRRERADLHPATISPATRSVSISVNGGTARVFNATTSSPNCVAGSGGTTCTFTVKAPPGTDTFLVTTYSAVSGGGIPLNRGTAVVPIVAGKANAPRIRLGPVVSTTADSGTGSLRYAIGSANPGDTIVFMIPAGSTIHALSTLTLNTNVSIAGPGVKASIRSHRNPRFPGLHSNLAFSGITISGGGTQQIIVVKAGVTATISGLILTDGLATTGGQPGGAVYSEGTVRLASDAFTDNGSVVDSSFVRGGPHAPQPRKLHHRAHPKPQVLHPHICITGAYYGGAVYNHGNMIVTGSTFDSNVLQNIFGCVYGYGGAIYNDKYGTLTSSGNTYSNNSAYYGGAVYNNSTYGQTSFTSDTFTGNTGCTASTGCASTVCGTPTVKCATYPTGYGGAIYDGAGPGVTITGSTFSNNSDGGTSASSEGFGGALYLANGAPSVTNSTFTGNQAGGGAANCSDGEGGAIWEDAGNTLELDNDTFTSNSAGGDQEGYGGAVFNNSIPDNGSGNKFTFNRAYATGSACENLGTASGGALYAYEGITMTGSTFTSNSVKANYNAFGGAVNGHIAATLTSDTFTSNSAVATSLLTPPNPQGLGGAIYSDAPLRLNTCTFTSNSAIAQSTTGKFAYGGAVYAYGTLTSNGNTFASNSATNATGGSPSVYGGGVYANGNLVSNGDKFTSNSASAKTSVYGGGLYANGTFGITNDTFTSNKVTATNGNAFGGGLGIGSSGTVSNSAFTSNTNSSTNPSDGYDHGGGAIEDDAGATFNGIKATGNSVTGGSGGAIWQGSGTETVNSSTFSGNSATAGSSLTYSGGGAIYIYDTSDFINNSTFTGNTAAVTGTESGGGAFYNDDGATITGSTFSGNKVTGSGTHNGGGALYNYYYPLTMTNDTISNNTSSVDGGGIDFDYQPVVLLNNVTLYQNTATGNGGNIFNDNSSAPYVTLANTIVAGGTAAAGKDVYNSGTMVSSDYNLFGTLPAGGGTFTMQLHDKRPSTPTGTLNPLLLTLSNNGGPTFTNSDSSTSPGKAYIPFNATTKACGSVASMPVDQRGFSRGAGGKCDIGAYEFEGTPSSLKVHLQPLLRLGPGKHPHRSKHAMPVNE